MGLKMPCVCGNLSIAVLLFHYKCISEDTSCSRRSVSEAAPCFGNLCVYEPSALWKKPSDSLKKPFDLWRKLCCKRIWKSIPNVSIIFLTCIVREM